MAPLDTSESDELDQLPSVPRLRRTAGKPPLPRYDAPSSKSKRRDEEVPFIQPSASRLRRQKRSEEVLFIQPSAPRLRRKKRSPRRQNRRRQKKSQELHSDDDENENNDSDPREVRRISRPQRRTLQTRKIIDDDDDEASDLDADDEAADGMVGSDQGEKESQDVHSKSDSVSPVRTKKRKSVANDDDSNSTDRYHDDPGLDTADTEGNEVIPGQNELLAKLEEENDNSDDFDSEDVEQERDIPRRRERLTSRQRAMQGEDVKLEYAKLESPKSKKKEPSEDWDHDEEVELKKQQKARLRQMIHEKRNKEKRAAMVDKVLRGVTSKRKKFTLASEARAAQVGTRLSQNEMREGCIRFVSNREGVTISIPEDVEEPLHLKGFVKAKYPPACRRDPRTGKRIFVS